MSIVSFNSFVDRPSCPELNLHFNLFSYTHYFPLHDNHFLSLIVISIF